MSMLSAPTLPSFYGPRSFSIPLSTEVSASLLQAQSATSARAVRLARERDANDAVARLGQEYSRDRADRIRRQMAQAATTSVFAATGGKIQALQLAEAARTNTEASYFRGDHLVRREIEEKQSGSSTERSTPRHPRRPAASSVGGSGGSSTERGHIGKRDRPRPDIDLFRGDGAASSTTPEDGADEVGALSHPQQHVATHGRRAVAGAGHQSLRSTPLPPSSLSPAPLQQQHQRAEPEPSSSRQSHLSDSGGSGSDDEDDWPPSSSSHSGKPPWWVRLNQSANASNTSPYAASNQSVYGNASGTAGVASAVSAATSVAPLPSMPASLHSHSHSSSTSSMRKFVSSSPLESSSALPSARRAAHAPAAQGPSVSVVFGSGHSVGSGVGPVASTQAWKRNKAGMRAPPPPPPPDATSTVATGVAAAAAAAASSSSSYDQGLAEAAQVKAANQRRRARFPYDRVSELHGFLSQKNIRQLLKKTNYNRRELYVIFNRFKALCALSPTPHGVDKHTFKKGVARLAVEDDRFVNRVFSLVDDDGSGQIEWEEFLTAMSALEKGDPEAKCRFFFQIYDLDADGFISRADLSTMFHSSSMLDDDETTAEVVSTFVNKVFRTFGAEASGKISYDDVIRYMKGEGAREDVWDVFGRSMLSSQGQQQRANGAR